jgi:hypothetical protein
VQVSGRAISSKMRAKAAASFMPSRRASCGAMCVIIVAAGEGSRSSAGRTYRLIGASISLRSASVRSAANCAMRVMRGFAP